MYTLEVGASSRFGLEGDHCVGNPGSLHPVDDRTQTLGPLGVAGPGEVFEITGVSGEQHGHSRDASAGNYRCSDDGRCHTLGAADWAAGWATDRRTPSERHHIARLGHDRAGSAVARTSGHRSVGAVSVRRPSHRSRPRAVVPAARADGLPVGAHHCARRSSRHRDVGPRVSACARSRVARAHVTPMVGTAGYSPVTFGFR